jgi:aryl-alcohol dehydrogenase-like predicted oxidoreductase
MAMLQFASGSGVDMIDTAIGYGESEICLGEAGVRDFKLITKLPAIPPGCIDVSGWVNEQVSASIARLGVEALYGLLLHRSADLLSSNGKSLYHALQKLKDDGQVGKVGVSIYSPQELNAIEQSFSLDLVQAPFNLVDQRLRSTGWLDRLKSIGIEVHARSVFLQGLLLVPRADVPVQFARWERLWDRWHQWLSANNVSALEACLAFPLGIEGIDRVVVGADNLNQLKQIMDASVSPLSIVSFPNLQSDEVNLINPAYWPKS